MGPPPSAPPVAGGHASHGDRRAEARAALPLHTLYQRRQRQAVELPGVEAHLGPDQALALLERRPEAYPALSPRLWTDPQFALAAVQRNSQVYLHLSIAHRDAPQIALAALAGDPGLLSSMPALRADRRFQSAAKRVVEGYVLQNPLQFPNLPELFLQSVRVTRAAVGLVPANILHARPRAQTTRNVRVAVKLDEASRDHGGPFADVKRRLNEQQQQRFARAQGRGGGLPDVNLEGLGALFLLLGS